MSNSKLVMSQAANSWEGPTYIEDVFSTYLYTGNSSTQTITNGIDLAGEGGLVWIKGRVTVSQYHVVYDTERGATKGIYTNDTLAEGTRSGGLTAFNADGFSVGNFDYENLSSDNFASWTFRKAPRFFDVVTYTGTGVAGHTINHNLGVTPACIIIKVTSTSNDWVVYHKDHPLNNTSTSTQYYMRLNQTNASYNAGSLVFDNISDTSFDLGTLTLVNGVGQSYVAYLFAHDPLGPSGDGSDGLIACGSYTGNGSNTGPVIDLGWEPQWLLVKNATNNVTDWVMYDTMRGWINSNLSVADNDTVLYANLSQADKLDADRVNPTSTGFTLVTSDIEHNASGSTYIYIAIRRGPMRQPTSGTEVFQPVAYTGTNVDNRLVDTGILTDMVLARIRTATSTLGFVVGDRLRGDNFLGTAVTNIEATDADSLDQLITGYGNAFSAMNGFGVGNDATRLLNGSSTSQLAYAFRRAPGFFDVVCYTGTGVARTVNHNLGVAPQLIVVKRRDSAASWYTYNETIGSANALALNTNLASFSSNASWNSTDPTSTVFTVNTENAVNGSGSTYVAYLFATLPGISKVGSYTGNGSSQTINCGFTGGARFVLIKRTDSTGDWYVWDTARGIVSGNDPHLSLNTTAAEVTTNDTIDPDSSGFIVNQDAATDVNVSSASYIYLAIA